ncbi:MAG: S1 RNA-binding domain-containing protein, partial [Thermoleophilia bacterium]
SELAERHVDIPEQVVSVGEEITVKVIDIDLDRRRISLSLKQAAQDQAQLNAPEDELALEEGAYQYAEGEYAEGVYADGTYAEGDYADGSYVYDEQGNPIGVMPGTAMAEAFQEAGFYEGTYEAEGQPAEGQPAEGQPAEEQAEAQAENQVQEGELVQEADAGQGQAPGDDTLENIVEDLKRKNAGE